MAAAGCVTAIRRVVESCSKNKPLLCELRTLCMPLMMHGMTADGLDSIEDVLDMTALFVYNEFEVGQVIPLELWKIFQHLLYIVVGKENDPDGGYAFEFLEQAIIVWINFIAKDQ